MLDRALTNPAATVPHPSPVRAVFERAVLAVERAADAERTAALRAQMAVAAEVAAADRAAGRQGGLHAARAAAAAAGGRTLPRSPQLGEPGDAERLAAARAELAGRPDTGTVPSPVGEPHTVDR